MEVKGQAVSHCCLAATRRSRHLLPVTSSALMSDFYSLIHPSIPPSIYHSSVHHHCFFLLHPSIYSSTIHPSHPVLPPSSLGPVLTNRPPLPPLLDWPSAVLQEDLSPGLDHQRSFRHDVSAGGSLLNFTSVSFHRIREWRCKLEGQKMNPSHFQSELNEDSVEGGETQGVLRPSRPRCDAGRQQMSHLGSPPPSRLFEGLIKVLLQ